MCSAIAILFLISRSKLVLDFALTIHFLHLLTTSLYSKSIPQNLLWWVLQIASATLMTSLGVWSCQYRELRPINFGGSAASAPATNHEAGSFSQTVEDEEDGVGNGRRGKGKDGGGEYEMVRMNGEASK